MFLYFEFVLRASVEVSKWNVDYALHVLTSPLTSSEVSTATEEATEEIERIMHPASSLATLLVLFHTFVAILIVDLPDLRIDENIICFGDLDEFLMRFLIIGVLIGVVFLGEVAVGFLDLTIVGVFC